MAQLILYHTGYQVIRVPDIHIGRVNADFGQGFYLSSDEAFSRRWARSRKGSDTWLNVYALETEGLSVKTFSRGAEWFDYIYRNRAARPDKLSQYDVITGPIANDTIYDTWGIMTSGLLKPAQALQLLSAGPSYTQTVIKTEKAVSKLKYLSSQLLSPE